MEPNEQQKGYPVNVYNWDSVLEKWVAAADINQNPLIRYMISDFDDAGDPEYFGFIDTDGNWYIMETNEALGTTRYIRGTENYGANWLIRDELIYRYYNEVF